MKKIILIWLFSVFLILNSFAQKTDEQIKDIRAKFKIIKDNENNYSKQKIKSDCGELVYFLEGNEIKKIEFERVFGGFANLYLYYFWNNDCFFAHWIIPQGGCVENSKVANLEYRFYYADSKPIRFMENQQIIDISKANHNPNETYQEAVKLLNAFILKNYSKVCD